MRSPGWQHDGKGRDDGLAGTNLHQCARERRRSLRQVLRTVTHLVVAKDYPALMRRAAILDLGGLGRHGEEGFIACTTSRRPHRDTQELHRVSPRLTATHGPCRRRSPPPGPPHTDAPTPPRLARNPTSAK